MLRNGLWINAENPMDKPMMKNAAAAPFIYFDGAPSMGVQNGMIEVELCARALMPKANGEIYTDIVCVAHLRCSRAAAANLREALTRTLDMVNEANLGGVQFPDGAPALKQ
jgi:hypothetical protein